MPPSKISTARNELHLIELLANGAPWKLTNIIDYCQGYWLLSRTDDNALLPKIKFEHGETELASD